MNDTSQFLEILVGMEIDVDGAPNAYGPPGKPALDFELNAHVGAKSSGAVVGYIMVRDPNNSGKLVPAIQKDGDPCPGYFISTTAFQDPNNKNQVDPKRYVNASKINYVVRGQEALEH